MTGNTGAADNDAATESAKGSEQRSEHGDETGPAVSRRNVLKASSTAVVGAAGLGAVSGTATASNCDITDDLDDDDFSLYECLEGATVDVECHKAVDLDPYWWQGEFDHNFSIGSDLPDNGEVLIYIHGYLAELLAEEQATLLHEATGFPKENVVSMVWPSDFTTYTDAWDDAAHYGRKTADWIMERLYPENGDDTTVKVVGHSLGGRACFNMLNRLQEKGHKVDYVVPVGPADNARFVGNYDESGERIYNYYYGIRHGAHNVTTLWSDDDMAVGYLHKKWANCFSWTPEPEDGEAYGLGAHGAIGPTPYNYEDVDVSDEVDNHCEYYKPDGDTKALKDALDL